MDPFHDFEVRLDGMPDTDTSATIVEEFRESYTLSAPFGVTGNWDAHIFTLPFTGAATLLGAAERSAGTTIGYNTSTTGIAGPFYHADEGTAFIQESKGGVTSAPVVASLLNIHGFATTGAPLAPSRDPAVHYAKPAIVAILGNQSGVGRRRLVGFAYEIHNTTADLYKQGTLTAYRMPQAPAVEMARGDQFYRDGSGNSIWTTPNLSYVGAVDAPPLTIANAHPGTVPYKVYNAPPSSVSLAMEYAGTRQWEARDGAYVVATQDPNRNKLAFNSSEYIALTDGDYFPPDVAGVQQNLPYEAWASASFTLSDAGLGDGSSTSAGPIAGVKRGQTLLHVPFHTSGVMLTGLSAQTTLTITARSVWEIAPVTGDGIASVNGINPLVPLASKPAEFDPIALELYQRAVIELPVAVPVSMNAAGDFWDWVLGAVETAAPMIGMALGGAPGSAAGTLVSGGIGKIRAGRNKADNARNEGKSLGKEDMANFKANSKPKVNANRAKALKDGHKMSNAELARRMVAEVSDQNPRRKKETEGAYKKRIDKLVEYLLE